MFVPSGNVELFHRVTSGAVLAGWTIERTGDVVIVRGPDVKRWWLSQRRKKTECSRALTSGQQKVLQQLRELREDDLDSLTDEWRKGFFEPEKWREWRKAKRRERRLLRTAVRVGLADHREVREFPLTMRAFGSRSVLRGTGLEYGMRAPFLSRAAPERLQRDEALIDTVLLLREHGLTLHRVYRVLKGLGQVPEKSA
jgi:hypothetical protein